MRTIGFVSRCANPAFEEGGNYLGSTRKSLGSTDNNEKQLVAFNEKVMEKCVGAFRVSMLLSPRYVHAFRSVKEFQ